MRMSLFLALCAVALPAQQNAVPADEDLCRARSQALDALSELLVGSESVEQLVAAADAEAESPALRYVLLQQALRCAERTGELTAARDIAGAIAAGFAVDGFELRTDMLRAFERARSVPALALLREYLALASERLEDADDARFRAAAAAAGELAERTADPVLIAFAACERRDLDAARAAWLAVADRPDGSAERGLYLCLYRGDWERGLPALHEGADERDARLSAVKAGTELDPHACLHIAESWLSRVKAEPDPLAQRRLRERGLLWYRRAWPRFDGLEQARITRQMDRLSDLLAARPSPSQFRFDGPADRGRMLITGGEWRVEDGVLRGRSLGSNVAARATCGVAFTRIDDVTIRGGIRTADNLNFRLAVGPLNVLFNWEVAPQNHFYLGEHRTVTTPPALAPGREHTIRVRCLAGEVAVFVDGELSFRAPAPGGLAGTVVVYPAIGSEIFVREILVDGEIDPLARVEGPSHTAR